MENLKQLVLGNGMSLNVACLEWKKDDFKSAFGSITREVNGKQAKRYNVDYIWKEVQRIKTEIKAEAKTEEKTEAPAEVSTEK